VSPRSVVSRTGDKRFGPWDSQKVVSGLRRESPADSYESYRFVRGMAGRRGPGQVLVFFGGKRNFSSVSMTWLQERTRFMWGGNTPRNVWRFCLPAEMLAFGWEKRLFFFIRRF